MSEAYDLIIIGGGVSGLGAALAAGRRGLKTLLLEKKKCSQATSANSLRIIHGGFRYLQSLNIKRVLQSQGDQEKLIRWAPEHIRPLSCAMPLKGFGFKSPVPLWFAARLYSGLGRISGSSRPSPAILGRKSTDLRLSGIARHAPWGALHWEDAVVSDPAAFAGFLVSEIRSLGVELHEGSLVQRIQTKDGAGVICREGAGTFEYRAKAIINTSGPWLGRIEMDCPSLFEGIKWCKAINMIVKRTCPGEHGSGLQSRMSRLFFTLPRGEHTAIGTWYEPFSGHPDELSATQEELERFVTDYNLAAPWAAVDLLDIIDLDVGVLPMKSLGADGPRLYGSEQIRRNGLLLEVMSTKYTTFLSQGERVVKMAEGIVRG